jgi:hypothetical protein
VPEPTPTPEINPATGLPDVPDGYFWRVKHYWVEYHTAPTLWVQLRKRAPWPLWPTRSVLVASRETDAEDETQKVWIRGYWRWALADPESVPENVAHLAALVWRDQRVSVEQEAARTALVRALDEVAGDYPPKVLS